MPVKRIKIKKAGGLPRRKRIIRRAPPGSAPGSFHFEDEKPAILKVKAFDKSTLIAKEFSNLSDAKTWMDGNTHLQFWLQVIGVGNVAFIKKLADLFHIHNLEMEDAVTGAFRPKLERHGDHTFSVHRILNFSKENMLTDEQVSIFLFPGCIISIQESEQDCFAPVKLRLQNPGTLLRTSSTFYLYYALVDAVIDNYFPLLENMESRLDNIEDALFDKPARHHLNDIQKIRKDLLVLKKYIISERDNLGELIRSLDYEEKNLFTIYLKDAHEHCLQILDLIDSQKEIVFSLIDVYLSSTNNRLGEVMKVLTIISSIFIPMTFVAGVYGMNFMAIGPEGEELPFNMPELHHPYGYLLALSLMALIGIFQIFFFKRKGWI